MQHHSLDGSCEDRRFMGKVMDLYARNTPPNYCNGRDSVRCARNLQSLPNPREISLEMQKFSATVPFANGRTRLIADFGQFVTHDIIQTPNLANGGPDPCNCKRTDVCINIDVRKKFIT